MSTPGTASVGAAPAHTAASIAAALGAEMTGPGDAVLSRLNTIDAAGPHEITFVRSNRYASAWAASRAGACIVSKDIVLPERPSGAPAAIIRVPDADLALIQVIRMFRPEDPAPHAGIHPTAAVAPGAIVDPTAHVGPMCVVEEGATIGPRAILRASVTIRRDAQVGEDSELEPGVVIHDRSTIGKRCLIHSNAVIGADGFGFRPSPDGRGVVKIPHAGIAEIHDDVEIGACSCVDRGKFGPTVIGAGTKIDNLVQIAHNVRIGRGCLIAAKTGIGGSTLIGEGVMIGGGSAIADNITIGPMARIGGGAAVMQDVPAREAWLGYPAKPRMKFFREVSTLARLVGVPRELGGRRTSGA